MTAPSPAPVQVFIGLGSNLGERMQQLRSALQFLSGMEETRLLACSSVYETAPVGPIIQPDFLNAVAECWTSLEPIALLQAIKCYEVSVGRVPGERWGPRPIDLDLLTYGNAELTLPELVVPHGEVSRRAFVLVPWAELAPELEVPGLGMRVVGLRDRQPSAARAGVRWFCPSPLELSTRWSRLP